jgi:hypothetical protein
LSFVLAAGVIGACGGDGSELTATVEPEVTTTTGRPTTTTTQVPSQPSGREAVCDRFRAEREELDPDEPIADFLRGMAGYARGTGDDEWAEVAESVLAIEAERQAILDEGFSDEARDSLDAFNRDLKEQTERFRSLNEENRQLLGELFLLCLGPT